MFATITSIAFSQVEVKTPGELKDHVGDSVKYCGKVASARLMDRTLNAPTFLNIDNPYPNQTFTVVIWKWDRANFQEKPEKFYLDKNVCIYGKLELFKETQLQITIHSEAQIVVQQ
jgi:hypothetical protein